MRQKIAVVGVSVVQREQQPAHLARKRRIDNGLVVFAGDVDPEFLRISAYVYRFGDIFICTYHNVV